MLGMWEDTPTLFYKKQGIMRLNCQLMFGNDVSHIEIHMQFLPQPPGRQLSLLHLLYTHSLQR